MRALRTGAFLAATSAALVAIVSIGATASWVHQDLPFGRMAERIVAALEPASEHVVLRYDPETLPELAAELGRRLSQSGNRVDYMPYGQVPNFSRRLEMSTVYVWLPAGPNAATTEAQAASLARWLDEGTGRQIHFHWGTGTIAMDGLDGTHSAVYDSIMVAGLDIDYEALDRAQREAVAVLRRGEVRVTTPAGTDLRFRIADRPVNRQNGDASVERMRTARIRIDREIELPAGVIRVAPIESSVSGRIVIPEARVGGTISRNVELTFAAGRVTRITASEGQAAFRAYLERSEGLQWFREVGIGFNPRLVRPAGTPWLPYYGYGLGVVRLSLGNNHELGGSVDGPGVRWFFFPDATVAVGEAVIVSPNMSMR